MQMIWLTTRIFDPKHIIILRAIMVIMSLLFMQIIFWHVHTIITL